MECQVTFACAREVDGIRLVRKNHTTQPVAELTDRAGSKQSNVPGILQETITDETRKYLGNLWLHNATPSSSHWEECTATDALATLGG